MILVHEPTWTGTDHAPGNSATVQVLAHAFPAETIRILADPPHLAELRRDTALTGLGRVEFVPAPLSPHFPFRPQLVSWRRGWRELRTLRAALRAVPRGEGVLVFLISTTTTSLFAASWLARWRPNTGVIVGWHGNLNDARGTWRPRNPLARALDFQSGLAARHPTRFRHLVLEEGIQSAMAPLWPAAAARTDVLPLPINLAEMPADTPALTPPIRVGLVGQATAAKGGDLFVAAARAAKARFGDQATFHLIGKLADGVDPAPYAILEEAPSLTHLPRAEFTARLARLHYAFLPLDQDYYGLAASGALIDAITWLKPVIVPRVPIVEALFRAHGDIGHMAESRDAMGPMLEAVLAAPDPARHAAQVANLRAARAARAPTALAARFRAIMRTHMPGLLRESET